MCEIAGYCRNGDLSSLKKYIKDNHIKMNDLNLKDGNNDTLLTLAAFYGHLNIVIYLIEECKVPIEQQGQDGGTAFFWASVRQQKSVLMYLVEHGANVNAKDVYGHNVLVRNIGKLHHVKYFVEQCHVSIHEKKRCKKVSSFLYPYQWRS